MTSLAKAWSFFHRLVYVQLAAKSPEAGNPMSLLGRELLTQFHALGDDCPMSSCVPELGRRWSTNRICRSARSFWVWVNQKQSFVLLALSKVNLAAIVGVLSGDCRIATQAVLLNIFLDTLCQSCLPLLLSCCQTEIEILR